MFRVDEIEKDTRNGREMNEQRLVHQQQAHRSRELPLFLPSHFIRSSVKLPYSFGLDHNWLTTQTMQYPD